jgi:hypothetical protein
VADPGTVEAVNVSRALLIEPALLSVAQQATELPGELREWMQSRSERRAARGA